MLYTHKALWQCFNITLSYVIMVARIYRWLAHKLPRFYLYNAARSANRMPRPYFVNKDTPWIAYTKHTTPTQAKTQSINAIHGLNKAIASVQGPSAA